MSSAEFSFVLCIYTMFVLYYIQSNKTTSWLHRAHERGRLLPPDNRRDSVKPRNNDKKMETIKNNRFSHFLLFYTYKKEKKNNCFSLGFS